MARKNITGTAKAPRWHFPRKLVALLVLAFLIIGGGLTNSWLALLRNTELPVPPAPAPAPAIVLPAPTVAPTPTPAPTIPLVEVQWMLVGTARNGTEVLALPIPWEKVGHSKEDWTSCGGMGTKDIGGRYESDYRFSPNGGTDCYKLANLPEVPYPVLPGIMGGVRDDNKLVIFALAQTQPWVYTYWRADIPLATLEGLSP